MAKTNAAAATDQGLQKRIEELVAEHTLRGLARKTGTSHQNITRYLGGAKPPASFCQSLVTELGIDPMWLLTGQGTPLLAHVDGQAQTTGGELLELVNATNALSKMRIGALAGKEQLALTRKLNEALHSYQTLRTQQRQHATKIFEQIVEKLHNAMDENRLDLAESLVKTGEQMVSLADYPHLTYAFNRLRGAYLARVGELELAVETMRDMLLYRLVDKRGFSSNSCADMSRLANALAGQLRYREAARLCDACIVMAGEQGRDWPEYNNMLMIAGLVNCQLGDVAKGSALCTQGLPKSSKMNRERSAGFMFAGAMFLAGTMSFEQVCEYADFPPLLLITFALWSEDEAHLTHVAKLLESQRSSEPLRLLAPKHYLTGLLNARRGDSNALAQLNRDMKNLESDRQFTELRRMTLPVMQAQVSLMLKDEKSALDYARKAEDLLAASEPELTLPILYRGIHYRNLLRLIPGDARSKNKQELRNKALAFFEKSMNQGCCCFDEVMDSGSE